MPPTNAGTIKIVELRLPSFVCTFLTSSTVDDYVDVPVVGARARFLMFCFQDIKLQIVLPMS